MCFVDGMCVVFGLTSRGSCCSDHQTWCLGGWTRWRGTRCFVRPLEWWDGSFRPPSRVVGWVASPTLWRGGTGRFPPSRVVGWVASSALWSGGMGRFVRPLERWDGLLRPPSSGGMGRFVGPAASRSISRSHLKRHMSSATRRASSSLVILIQ